MSYSGLGAPTLPAGEDPVVAANDLNFTLAVQYGVEPDTEAGYDDYYNARMSFATGGRKAVTLAHPELAALIASGMAAGVYGTLGVNAILSLMLTPSSNVVDQVQGIWPDLPSDIVQRYTAAVQTFLPLFLSAPSPVVSLTDPVEQWKVTYQAALATGPNVSIPDQQGGSVQIPLAYVLEGPVTLPDGMAYIVVKQADGPHVTWWQTPQFVPLQYQDVFVRPDSCEPVVPGTGPWYMRASVTGNAGPCSGVPVGWSQGFGLVSATARASLSFAPIAPLKLADNTVIVQPINADVQVTSIQADPRIDASAGDPTQPIPSTSDASGLSQPTQPSYLPAVYSPLPPAVVSVPPSSSTMILAVLAAVAGTLVIIKAGKRDR